MLLICFCVLLHRSMHGLLRPASQASPNSPPPGSMLCAGHGEVAACAAAAYGLDRGLEEREGDNFERRVEASQEQNSGRRQQGRK